MNIKVQRWTGPVSAHGAGGFVSYGDYLQLLRAAEALRAAQRDYMANRGNEVKGRAVAEAAVHLDKVIGLAPLQAARSPAPEGRDDEVRF